MRGTWSKGILKGNCTYDQPAIRFDGLFVQVGHDTACLAPAAACMHMYYCLCAHLLLPVCSPASACIRICCCLFVTLLLPVCCWCGGWSPCPTRLSMPYLQACPPATACYCLLLTTSLPACYCRCPTQGVPAGLCSYMCATACALRRVCKQAHEATRVLLPVIYAGCASRPMQLHVCYCLCPMQGVPAGP